LKIASRGATMTVDWEQRVGELLVRDRQDVRGADIVEVDNAPVAA